MSFLAAAIAAPFAAAGGLVRLTSSLVFARGRSWALWIQRTRVNYRRSVGDPLENSIVGSVVGWIARNFPAAPVRIVRETDPDGPPIVRSQTGPGAMLRLLENPNPFFSGKALLKALVVDYLRGDAYLFKVRSDSGRVTELWWVPRQMLKPAWPADNPDVFIGWYEYSVDGEKFKIDPRDVVHFRNGMNPDDQGRTGVDELASLWREIFTDEEAAAFTAALLQNLGIPGVVIAPSNTTSGAGAGRRLLQADPEAVKKKFMDSFEGDHRGEPLVFGTPTDVKVLSWNPQQLDLKALRRIPEERISARLGVPAGVAGMGAGLDRNTFTNYGEARVAAYTEGVIPRQDDFAAVLESQLLPEFVGRDAIETYDVYFDALSTPAMQALRESIARQAASDATKGLMTRAQYKRLTRQPVAKDGSDDVYVLPNNIRIIPSTVGAGGVAVEPAVPPARPRQVGPGAHPVALLTAGAEVRCTKCDRLLAEQATPPYRLKCGRCHTLNEASIIDPEPAAA